MSNMLDLDIFVYFYLKDVVNVLNDVVNVALLNWRLFDDGANPFPGFGDPDFITAIQINENGREIKSRCLPTLRCEIDKLSF